MARSNRWKNSFFYQLPCSTAGHVAIGRPICIINMPHVTVIIRHICRLYRVAVFIAIIAFSGWIVNVCQEAHVSLVLPHHSRQVTPGPYSNVSIAKVGVAPLHPPTLVLHDIYPRRCPNPLRFLVFHFETARELFSHTKHHHVALSTKLQYN